MRIEGRFRGSQRRERCRELRREETAAEAAFWALVRDRRFDGLKFRRQQPLGNYIADFYCFEQKLIVEIDGLVHHAMDQQRRDRDREAALSAYGLRFFRVPNSDVLVSPETVLARLQSFLTSPPSQSTPSSSPSSSSPSSSSPPSPSPMERGRGGEARSPGGIG